MNRTVSDIEFEKIEVNWDNNGRKTYKNIASLADNIEAEGLLEPLGVRVIKGHTTRRYVLDYGFRRYKAIELLRSRTKGAFEKVPVVILKGNEEDSAVATAIENLQREDLTPGEVSLTFNRLENLGLSRSDIARRIGMSKGHVSLLLGLREKLSAKAFKAFVDGVLPTDIAREIGDFDPEEQDAKIAEIRAEGAGGGDAEETKKAQRKKSREVVKAKRPGLKAIRYQYERVTVGDTLTPYRMGAAAALRFVMGETETIADEATA